MENKKALLTPNGDAVSKISPKYVILFYVPNLIGYVRLLLLVASFYFFNAPVWFVFLYSCSIYLDSIDGYTARKLNQCSLFGAWLDVAIDNFGRGLLWTHIHPMCYLVTALEWCAFVCNHQLGPEWRELLMMQNRKTSNCYDPPVFVSKVLSNNFRSIWGFWAIAGLHVLPIWIYGFQKDVFQTLLSFLPSWMPLSGLIFLLTGRFLCLLVEIWCIWVHILLLISKEIYKKERIVNM